MMLDLAFWLTGGWELARCRPNAAGQSVAGLGEGPTEPITADLSRAKLGAFSKVRGRIGTELRVPRSPTRERLAEAQ